jgi:hypothetical protein
MRDNDVSKDDEKMRDTSLAAYKEVEPKLAAKQQAVLDAIAKAKRPVNNQEISIHLHMPINTITPRTKELVELDKIELSFKAVFPQTGRKVCYWKIK